MKIKKFLRNSFLSLSLMSVLASYSFPTVSKVKADSLQEKTFVYEPKSDSITSKDYQTLDSLIRSSTIKISDIHFDSVVLQPSSHHPKSIESPPFDRQLISFYGTFAFEKSVSKGSDSQSISLDSIVDDSSKLIPTGIPILDSALSSYSKKYLDLDRNNFIKQSALQKKISVDLENRKSDLTFFFDYLNKTIISDSETRYEVLIKITEQDFVSSNYILDMRLLDFTLKNEDLFSTDTLSRFSKSNKLILEPVSSFENDEVNEIKKQIPGSRQNENSVGFLVGSYYNLSENYFIPSVKLSVPLVKNLSLLLGWTKYKTDSSYYSLIEPDVKPAVQAGIYESHFDNVRSVSVKTDYFLDLGLSYKLNSWTVGLTASFGLKKKTDSDQLLQKTFLLATGELLEDAVPVGNSQKCSTSKLVVGVPGLFLEKVFKTNVGFYLGSSYNLKNSSFFLSAGFSYRFSRK